jgi:hypothetical protein
MTTEDLLTYYEFHPSDLQELSPLMKAVIRSLSHQGNPVAPQEDKGALYNKHIQNLEYRMLTANSITNLIKRNDFYLLNLYFPKDAIENKDFEIIGKYIFKNKELEIYYNGERGLTEFVINCYTKEGKYWRNIGKYTTDFLLIKRDKKDKIHKALLIETKGALYAEDKVFQRKKNYVENDFLKLNQEKFGYQRFDFLYIEDSKNIEANITKLNNKINQFFND